VDAGADDRALGALPDQRRVVRHPVAGQRRHVAHRLDEVGLALAVRPGEDRHARPERDVNARVRAEVRQRQAGQVHALNYPAERIGIRTYR
jgi:hypothetical protein